MSIILWCQNFSLSIRISQQNQSHIRIYFNTSFRGLDGLLFCTVDQQKKLVGKNLVTLSL